MPKGQFPQKNTGNHCGGIGGTDICAAELKTEKQPAVKESKNEQRIRKGGMPWPERAKKTIDQPQSSPCQQAAAETHCGKIRRRQENRRLSQPPGARSCS